MIVGESQCLPHQLIPPTTPDSARSGDAIKSEDSKSSMIITRLGCIGWSKTSQKDIHSGKEEERERGRERDRERKIVRAGMEDAKKEVQAMKRHAKRQSGLMDSRASNDSADQGISDTEQVLDTASRSFWASVAGVDKLNHTCAEESSGHMKNMTTIGVCNAQTERSPSFRFNEISDRIDVDFHSLTLTLKGNGNTVLKNLCGAFRAGHITAIIGPSGAGKTSLLSLLRGQTYYAKIGGVIRVNKVPVKSLRGFRDRVAYVPQEDVLYNDLTVEENIMFSAMLFNRRGLRKNHDLYPLVNHALQLLGIKFICNSVVGSQERKGISGGQRRRVSVAIEMMKEADMFLLDEPTSGLDSGTSISLMNCLHSLSSLGTNIVATLHQPRNEIFNLVNHVILLAPGGRIAYTGHPQSLSSHFYSLSFCCPLQTNVADFVMDVMSGFVCLRGTDSLLPVEIIIAYLCDWWEKTEYPRFRTTFDHGLLHSIASFSSPSPSTSLSLSPSQSPFHVDRQQVANYSGFGKESSRLSSKFCAQESNSSTNPFLAFSTLREDQSLRSGMPDQTRANGSLGSVESCEIVDVTMNEIIVKCQYDATSKLGSMSTKLQQNSKLLGQDRFSPSNHCIEVAGLRELNDNKKKGDGVSALYDPNQEKVPNHIKITVSGCQEIAESASASSGGCTDSSKKTFCRLKYCAGLRTRIIRNRSTFCVVLIRQFRLFNRSIGSLKSDCTLLFALGSIIALLFGTVQISRYSGGGFAGQVSSMQLAFALLIMSSSLRLFSADSNIRKREEEGGVYIVPYYGGKVCGQSLEVIAAPLAFLFGYYALATPGGSFTDYWLFTILLYIAVMGIANLVAVIIPGKGKGLIANGLIVILWSFGGLAPTSEILRTRLGIFGVLINCLSPFKWTFEFQMLAEFKTYSVAFDVQIDKYLTQFEYSRQDFNVCIGWLILHALSSNTLAVMWLLWAKDNFKYWRFLSDSVLRCVRSTCANSRPFCRKKKSANIGMD